MATINNNNKIKSYLIILLGLFILVLFTTNEFTKIQATLDDKYLAESNLQTARDRVDRLNALEAKYSDQNLEVNKYLQGFSEDKIIKYIFNEIESKNMTGENNEVTTIRSISMNSGNVNEIGFRESNIIFNFRVPNTQKLKEILDFFVKEDSQYKFFIESFTMPTTMVEDSLNVALPLKLFYR